MATVGAFIIFLTSVAIFLLFARIIIDWVQVFARSWRPRGVIAALCEAVFSVTDPPLRAIRSVIPPIRMGGAMLDLSAVVLLIGIYLVRAIVASTMF
jgi:YggT family protein